MHVILIVIAVVSVTLSALMFAHESRQIVGQRTYSRPDRRFFVALGTLLVVLSFFLPYQLEDGYYQLITIPGIAFILYGTRRVSLSYHGLFNGLFFIEWPEIESIRRDRTRKNCFIIRTKTRTARHLYLDRFTLHVHTRYADDVNDAIIRNLP